MYVPFRSLYRTYGCSVDNAVTLFFCCPTILCMTALPYLGSTIDTVQTDLLAIKSYNCNIFPKYNYNR